MIGHKTYGDVPIPEGQEHYINVGKYCSIAKGLRFLVGCNHDVRCLSTYTHTGCKNREPRPVEVGNDVWIGEGVMLMDGAVIEDGAVIGAYSVVRGRIPAYSIAYGNPCITQRMRFSEDEVRDMLEIAWWNWDDEKVEEASSFLTSTNIKEFIRRYKCQ